MFERASNLYTFMGATGSGKSRLAEEFTATLKQPCSRLIYLATMRNPTEPENQQKIERHVAQRKHLSFVTLPCFGKISDCFADLAKTDTVLLDCLGNVVANCLYVEAEGQYLERQADMVVSEITDDIAVLSQQVGYLVVVLPDVFRSLEQPQFVGNYIKVLGNVSVWLGRHSRATYEVSAGIAHFLTREVSCV